MSDPAASASAATGETPPTTSLSKTRAPASNFLSIVRGRLPLLFVHAVRFDEVLAKMGNKDLATKLATSIGKVFDIRKGRNFSYITKDYKPSADDLAQAKAWVTQVGTPNAKGLTALGDPKLMNDLIAQYEAAGLATAEDVAKMSEARAATRAPRAPRTSTSGATAGATTTAETLTTGDVKQTTAEELLG